MTPWTVAHQAPLSMAFSGQEYWSGSPFPSPGDLPDPGMEPRSPALQADSLLSKPPGKPHVNQSDSQHPTVVPRLCPIHTPLHYLTGFASYDSPPWLFHLQQDQPLCSAYTFQARFNLRTFALAALSAWNTFSVINRPHPPEVGGPFLQVTSQMSLCQWRSPTSSGRDSHPLPHSISPSEQAGGGWERTGSGLAPGDSCEVQEVLSSGNGLKVEQTGLVDGPAVGPVRGGEESKKKPG